MNKERILELADFLETLSDEQFDMERWVSSCGTVGCMAGWIYIQQHGAQEAVKQLKNIFDIPIFETARDYLGLTDGEADYLFMALNEDRKRVVMLFEITRQHAITALRQLAETGEFDWKEIVQ